MILLLFHTLKAVIIVVLLVLLEKNEAIKLWEKANLNKKSGTL